jgi:hypothetical protein
MNSVPASGGQQPEVVMYERHRLVVVAATVAGAAGAGTLLGITAANRLLPEPVVCR